MVGKTRDVDFRQLFESAPGLYLVLAVDPPRFTIVAASDNYLRATMTRREEIVERGIFEVFPDNPADPDATGVANLRASLERALRTLASDAMAVQKYDIRRPDGAGFEERFWSPTNTPVVAKDGGARYIIHRVEDVTDFLRMKEARVVEQEEAGVLRARTEAMEVEIFRRAQEVQQKNDELRKLYAELEARVEERTAELRSEMAERERAERALRRSEEQLRQAQKLEAVGRLAGGVAHDFNNLLSVILSYCELATEDLPMEDPLRESFDQIHRAGQRAADLTSQMLAFSRQQHLEPKILDLNEILPSLIKMLARLVGDDVDLTLNLLPGVRRIRADRGQIEQVVMNLVVNARDALPRGGKLTVQTANVVLDEAYARDHADVTPGPHVMLGVSDSGIGMDAATQSRIFEPFFTTKERGKGTGLGLSTVFGIVRQSGGHIWLYSELGHGTTFKLYFPAVDAEADVPVESVSARDVGARAGEAILLVEDQAQVRTVATSILRRAGYRVFEASGPLEALLLCQQPPAPIQLLVTDVIMPKLNGRELADQIRVIMPSIKVLFMSGYTDEVILEHGVFDTRVAFVEKPLTPDRLLRKVREVLGT